VVRVVDVPLTTRGRVLRVLMNAELEEAIGMLARPDDERDDPMPTPAEGDGRDRSETFWRWRMHMAERIAEELDPEHFGVAALYIIGSTKNANAGPSSDIDFIVHVRGTDEQRRELETWLEGWSQCLGEMNYLRTGYRTGGLLDVHFVTDEDIDKGSSFAAKINAVTDPALELPIRRPQNAE
jgi:predicted nucleotidyltransferase